MFKLGRINKPLPVDAPRITSQFKMMAELAPVRVDRRNVDYRPALDRNDEMGNCTCVALANSIRAQAALNRYQVDIPTDKVVALYSDVSNYPTEDNGAYELDVLAYQSRHGFDTGGQTAYVGVWGTMDRTNLNMARMAIAHMGSVYLAVNLAISDQNMDGVWDTNTPASSGDPMPGSWGGHAVLAWDYTGLDDTDTVSIVTWGKLQRATWRWYKSRVLETHALYHPQMVSPNRLNFAGIDRDRLNADIARYSGMAS